LLKWVSKSPDFPVGKFLIPSYIVGIVIDPPIQAAFYTAAGGGISNWRGSQYGFYFVIGWMSLAMVGIATWLPVSHPNSNLQSDSQETRGMRAGIAAESETKTVGV
jgi:hypothetical protein